MISKYLFSIFAVAAVSLGTVATAQQFPATIQDCIDRGSCTRPVRIGASPFSGARVMEQYQYTDLSLIHI